MGAIKWTLKLPPTPTLHRKNWFLSPWNCLQSLLMIYHSFPHSSMYQDSMLQLLSHWCYSLYCFVWSDVIKFSLKICESFKIWRMSMEDLSSSPWVECFRIFPANYFVKVSTSHGTYCNHRLYNHAFCATKIDAYNLSQTFGLLF